MMARGRALVMWALAVALLALAGSASAQTSAAVVAAAFPRGTPATFPFCQCLSYDCNCSPYRVDLTESSRSNGVSRTCYTVNYIGCDERLECCRALLASVEKISFETTAACSNKSSIFNITINGDWWPNWNPYTYPKGYELKVYNMKASNATLPGTEICITSQSPCATSSDICSSTTYNSCRYSIMDKGDALYCPICQHPPPPPSPRPPRPPPPSPPPPCVVCIYVTLIPLITPNPNTYSFSQQTCEDVGAVIAADLNDQAATPDINLLTGFVLTECTPSLIKVCGTFFSDEDGAKLQDFVTSQFPFWIQLITGATCLPELAGYRVRAEALGPNGEVTCISGFDTQDCAPLSPPPPPSPSPPPPSPSPPPPPSPRPPRPPRPPPKPSPPPPPPSPRPPRNPPSPRPPRPPPKPKSPPPSPRPPRPPPPSPLPPSPPPPSPLPPSPPPPLAASSPPSPAFPVPSLAAAPVPSSALAPPPSPPAAFPLSSLAPSPVPPAALAPPPSPTAPVPLASFPASSLSLAPFPAAPLPSSAFSYITIRPPADLDGRELLTFSNSLCVELLAIINELFADAAFDQGATILEPLTLVTCDPSYDPETNTLPSFKACGKLASTEDGTKLQVWLDEGGQTDITNLLTNGSCPAIISDYVFTSWTNGPGGRLDEPDEGSCIYARDQQTCVPKSSPTPVPPSPEPAPSPTPSPNRVQTHVCAEATRNIPYILGGLTVAPTVDKLGDAAVQICTQLSPRLECRLAGYCCKMDVAKLEIPVSAACKSEVRAISINGDSTSSYSWGFYESFSTLKFVNLRSVIPDPAGATLCAIVRPGPCAQLENFCLYPNCQASIFSSNNKCCPTADLN
ncbi:hypothetical protein HYH03_015617 [Edaphochlamys debaryana]|uniref:Pherophorin domain-containing protein n=1 Tax=Edaphochlamys debaryana TaxID=47281 RepID=A0A835XRI2_9CHLO|nr:hypothetical protein HYH03_015617 [Edaphochlamys debaryana]|eukprot:KAG2485645.1 hypothetical protein HYH03_015617 [Edaphochlamys debaryana]